MKRQHNALLVFLLAVAVLVHVKGAVAQVPSDQIPSTMAECEDTEGCSTWSFQGTQGHGQWSNGAVADLSVEHFDASIVSIRRVDTTGIGQGITALYTGTRKGDRIDGTVTWSWPGHGQLSTGTTNWHATIQHLALDSTGASPNSARDLNGEAAAQNQYGVHIPYALAVCETRFLGGDSEFCTTRMLKGQKVTEDDGADTTLTVDRFDVGGINITIKMGKGTGAYTGTYTGKLAGDRIQGTSTWTGPPNRTWTSKWTALIIPNPPPDLLNQNQNPVNVPVLMSVCQTSSPSTKESCFNWVRANERIASATTLLTVERFDAGRVVIAGVDAQAKAVVTYTGKLEGDHINGTISWANAEGRSWSGKWKANLPNAAAAAASTPTSLPPNLPNALRVCSNSGADKSESCSEWVRVGDKLAASNNQGGIGAVFSIERFDSGGVMLSSENPAAGVTYAYRGKLEGNHIVGTYSASSPAGVMKGSWQATFFRPPPSTARGWNVYVTHGNQVSIINSATHAFKTVDLPSDKLVGLAVAPDGAKAYVASEYGPLYLIDGSSGSLAATFSFKGTAMPYGFYGVAVSPDGRMIYGSGRIPTGFGIGVMDSSTGTITRTIQVPGGEPGGPMVAIGSKLYADFRGLKAIDLSKGTVTGDYDRTVFLAVSGDGSHVYNNGSAIDTATDKESIIGLGNNNDTELSLAVALDGTTAYQSDGVGQVCVVSLKAGFCSLNIPVGYRPQGMGVTPDGATLFVSNFDGTVYTIDTKTNSVTDVIPVGGGRTRVNHFQLAIQPPHYKH